MAPRVLGRGFAQAILLVGCAACVRVNALVPIAPGEVELERDLAVTGPTIDDGAAREIAAESVRLESFAMQAHEVTVAEYWRCVDAGVCLPPEPRDRPECNSSPDRHGRHPINCVDEARARTYCEWLGLRLPSEAEWIWVAQNLDEQTRFSWGEERPSCRVTVARARRPGCGRGRAHPVESKSRDVTSSGVHDLGGNVMELVETSDGVVPFGGHAWTNFENEFEAQARRGMWRGQRRPPTDDRRDVGFRCVGDGAAA